MSYNMSIIKNDNNINEININNKKIASIYYGNILVYSSLNNIEIVFRDIDKNGNLTLATGSLTGYFDDIKIIGSNGLFCAFHGCTGITGSISFPNLTTINTYGLGNAFDGCTGITEIHFRADVKSVVESTDGYSSKFGASRATIYFDL